MSRLFVFLLLTVSQFFRTLASGKYPPFPQKELLAFCRDKDAIYYKIGGEEPQPTPAVQPNSVNSTITTPKPVAPEVVAAPVAPVSSAPRSGPVADAPVSAIEVLQVVLATKLHRQLNEITADKSIKVICC